MKEISTYLQSQRVPQYLIDEMMIHASNDMYWLKDCDLQSLGVYQSGVEEELIAKCGYNSKREANMTGKEFYKYYTDGGIGVCIGKYLSNTYKPLRDAAFAKMRQGWRPWKD